jgi:hypothetical protein
VSDTEVVVRSVTFQQNADSCDGGGEQELTVLIEDAGGGSYYVLRTERWAVDSELEVVKLLKAVNAAVEAAM